MKEKDQTKRKEWIKNTAIIFLVIMLLLTFFSNTIMNYSLPEVATQYVQSGTITAKIRGTGTVEASDPYNVEVTETRKIASVAVLKGDTVEKGDVLYYLEDSDSTELTEAQKTLNSLVAAFETALLSADVSSEVYNHVQTGTETSVSQYRAELDKAIAKVTNAQKSVDDNQKTVTDLTNKINILEATIVDTSVEQKVLDTANTNLTNATTNLSSKTDTYNSAKSTFEAYGTSVADATTAYDNAKLAYDANPTDADLLLAYQNAKTNLENVTLAYNAYTNAYANLTTAQNSYNTCKQAVTNAEKALADKKATATSDATLNSLKLQLTTAQTKLDAATVTLTTAQTEKTELAAKIQMELTLGAQYDAIEEQKKVVADLTAKSIGATVAAPIGGIVTTLAHVAGESMNAGETVAIIQPLEKGFTLSMSVTNEQAKKVSVGDIAEINSWYYNDITATLSAIKADTSNPSTNKLLVFTITGSDITAGQTLNLSVGQKSANYDLIVPNSALREDSNGKFILIVESKSSPLGNRYMATRVDVEVIASDDTQTAVTGALYGYEYVITTATKPVEAGKQVRLAD